MGFKEDQWDLMMILRVTTPWGFCDLVLWLCGRIGSGCYGKEYFSESFPTHQRTSDFVERIKSYDRLKLLVCIQRLLVHVQRFLVTVFQQRSISQISRNFLGESC
jgi:hypothetical protein